MYVVLDSITIITYMVVIVIRVTTCLENLEMSGISTAVREMSGILLKVREKWPSYIDVTNVGDEQDRWSME